MRGDDEATVTEGGVRGPRTLGWIDGEALRCGEIVDAGAVPDDLRGPMERAARDGCALVVYDED